MKLFIAACLLAVSLAQTECTYVQTNTGGFAENFEVGTDGCVGNTGCQFLTLSEAQAFCNSQSECTAVLDHTLPNNAVNCAGGYGCFTPRKGEGSGTWSGITYEKDSCSNIEQCEEFEFVHEGHCNGGWIPPNTIQTSLQACRDECSKPTINAGYFAWSVTSTSCSCYSLNDGCPEDNEFPGHNSYRILPECDLPLATVVWNDGCDGNIVLSTQSHETLSACEDGDTHFYMYTCDDAALTKAIYSDSGCQTMTSSMTFANGLPQDIGIDNVCVAHYFDCESYVMPTSEIPQPSNPISFTMDVYVGDTCDGTPAASTSAMATGDDVCITNEDGESFKVECTGSSIVSTPYTDATCTTVNTSETPDTITPTGCESESTDPDAGISMITTVQCAASQTGEEVGDVEVLDDCHHGPCVNHGCWHGDDDSLLLGDDDDSSSDDTPSCHCKHGYSGPFCELPPHMHEDDLKRCSCRSFQRVDQDGKKSPPLTGRIMCQNRFNGPPHKHCNLATLPLYEGTGCPQDTCTFLRSLAYGR